MKIVGVVCSPRKEGNTEIMVREALKAVHEAGHETDLFLVAGKNIAPCDACGACDKDGVCKIKDDMQELYRMLESSDGIIFGTPVYMANVSAQAKAVMDRTYALRRAGKLRSKVAAALVVARRVGAGQVLSILYSFFVFQRMIIAGGGIGYGRDKGDVKQGVGGAPAFSALEEARAVGTSVVRMLERVTKGSRQAQT